MEVSSHALVMGRVDGVVFDVAVFTNLGRDHLDFHADVEDYFAAKASLFTPERARRGLVNVDDEHGRRLLDEASVPVRRSRRRAPTPTGGPSTSTSAPAARVHRARPRRASVAGAACRCPATSTSPTPRAPSPPPARPGWTRSRGRRRHRAGGGVPGRLERVDAGQDFLAVVDYAHKPDAVEAALARPAPGDPGRLMVVIGAGGDRDPGKRPVMGEIAARLADVLVVTDDNPRSEDPAAIRAAVLAGPRAARGAEVVEVGDRRRRSATPSSAAAGDTVLIAGKGHETGQEIGGAVHPFDDRPVAREELREQAVIPMTLAEIAERRRRRGRTASRTRSTGRRSSTAATPEPGGLFVAFEGEHVDGHDFAGGRRRRAAAALGTGRRRPDGGRRRRRWSALGRLAPHVRRRAADAHRRPHRLAGQDRHQGQAGRTCRRRVGPTIATAG